jgi:predicted PurR-regulated permease PerM
VNGWTTQRSFLTVLVFATAAFVWLVTPLAGPILWAIVMAMLFAPLNRRLVRAMPRRKSLAAAITLVAIIACLLVPAILLGVALVDEVGVMIAGLRSGNSATIDLLARVRTTLPKWLLDMIGPDSFSDLDSARQWVATNFADQLQGAVRRALSIGQSAFGVLIQLSVLLYLSFFFVRDGERIVAHLRRVAPLDAERGGALLERFISVVHATIKGSLVVALVQGTVGGVVFWAIGVHAALLWGVAMAFMSLLPAVGSGVIWVPAAIYLLATGAIWQGATLVFCGLFVIGMVDNILRPILVGREARIPGYVAFVATLGGLHLFGINGLILGPAIAGLFFSAWELHVAGVRKLRVEGETVGLAAPDDAET